MKISISIFTPAYNRAHTLRRCYESILAQENLEQIEWIVINDGSVDNTDILMEEIISEKKLNIVYLKQGNQGKQSAWNRAILMAQGKFFVGLDSDDALQKKMLFQILNEHHHTLKDELIIGVRCLAINSVTQKPSGRAISKDSVILSWFDEFSDKNNFGERIDILKTEEIKKFLFPIKSDIKFIPEIWFYTSIAHANYKFIYSPQPLSLFFNEEVTNRLSKSNIFTHAEGHYIARSLMLKIIPMKVWVKNPIGLLKTFIRFSQFAKFLNKGISERIQDTNLLFAVCSYILSPILNNKG